tara:strand:+ start:1288 stop:2886 length:1599 start_codon:yes stop_codon:yes gene_type:complete
MIYINQFFYNVSHQLRKLYLNSNLYNKKISKINDNDFFYKPSPHLLSSLIKYQKKKFKIEDFSSTEIWNKDIKQKEFKNLNSFYWFFSLDLKSSKEAVQSIISSWILLNKKFNYQSWDFDITAKRIIAWLSCYNITFENADKEYQKNFNFMIKKQTNHLVNEINKSKHVEDKLIGCAAVILVGLCYKIEKNYLLYGLEILKKISKFTLDNSGFPKTRNFKQLVFFLKYHILIREWFKEAQVNVPEHIEETIYYLGQSYSFIWQNTYKDLFFNGNTNSNNLEFDSYLKRLGYKFKNESHDFGGYLILKNKKTCLAMDVGSTPNSIYTKDYQSGALSFEIIRNGKKLICNCGYYNKGYNKINKISKSTASQSTLVIDDQSSCKINNLSYIQRGLKILKKDVIFKKDYWKIKASHDGYFKKYNLIHEREIEFYPDPMKFLGTDKIIQRKINHNYKFDIRFHVEPNVKLMKTQDNKTILIELDDEGWKFTCEKFSIDIDYGLYFGNKNSYTENQNIFVSGVTNNQVENIKWQIEKI